MGGNHNPGASVLIIYFILLKNDKIDDWFTAKFIYDEYEKFKESPEYNKCITNIRVDFEKHGELKNLSSISNINGWIKKHIDIKPVYWFIKRKNISGLYEFRIKETLIPRLQKALNTLPACIQ